MSRKYTININERNEAIRQLLYKTNRYSSKEDYGKFERTKNHLLRMEEAKYQYEPKVIDIRYIVCNKTEYNMYKYVCK